MGQTDAEQEQAHRAYHEAGHVIADLVSGFRFTGVSLQPGEPGEYEGMHGSIRGRAKDLAIVQLAGIVASARMAGTDPWETPPRYDDDSADLATAEGFIGDWAAFVARTYGGSPPGDQLWITAEKDTRDLVDRNWEAITVIATALLERQALSYDEIIRILKDRGCEPRAGIRDQSRE